MTHEEDMKELINGGIDALLEQEERLSNDLEKIYQCMNDLVPITSVMYVIEKQLRRKGLWVEARIHRLENPSTAMSHMADKLSLSKKKSCQKVNNEN